MQQYILSSDNQIQNSMPIKSEKKTDQARGPGLPILARAPGPDESFNFYTHCLLTTNCNLEWLGSMFNNSAVSVLL